MEFKKGQKFRVINAKGLNDSVDYDCDYFTDGQILEFNQVNNLYELVEFEDSEYMLSQDEIEKFLEVVEDSFHYMVTYTYKGVNGHGVGRCFVKGSRELNTRESIEELENDITTRNDHKGVLITNIIELRG